MTNNNIITLGKFLRNTLACLLGGVLFIVPGDPLGDALKCLVR